VSVNNKVHRISISSNDDLQIYWAKAEEEDKEVHVALQSPTLPPKSKFGKGTCPKEQNCFGEKLK
jgi:hypothetical protein